MRDSGCRIQDSILPSGTIPTSRVEQISIFVPHPESCILNPVSHLSHPSPRSLPSPPSGLIFYNPGMPSKIRVVVADDEQPYRNALQRTLTLMPECELVGIAKDGQEALDVCNAELPDVLLTDINMP